MFSEPLSKSSRGFTYVFLIAVNPATLKSIDDPTLFKDWILILGSHQEAFDGFPPLKYTCIPWLLQVFLRISLTPL